MAKQTSISKTQDIEVIDGQVSEEKTKTTVTSETSNQISKKPKEEKTETLDIQIDHEE